MLIRNVAANLLGQLVYPLLALLLVPFYVHHLGLEAYGLIGLMALVASLLAVMSRGLGGALQREIGRRARTPDAATLRRLVRSMEVVYWGVAGATLLLLAPLAAGIGADWIRPEALPRATVAVCLVLLAIRVSVAFPQSVYQSVLLGTERQVLGSALTAALALATALGGVAAVLIFQSVLAYFVSETVTAALGVLVLRRFAFRGLPDGHAAFDAREVRALVGMSLALMWTSGIGLLLSNLDRVVVSALLPVSALAVYTMTVMAGRLVTLLSNPVLQAAYPRMCHVARSGTVEDQVRDLLRNAAALTVVTAICVFPLSAFASEVLAVWVRDASVVQAGATALSVYTIASALIAFASVLYQWQTATGRTGPAAMFNAIALIWFPLALWGLVSRAGLTGAAVSWALYGGLAWVTNLVVTFGRGHLPAPAARQYLRLIAAGLIPSLLCTLGARLAADVWFADSLAGRVSCAGVAGFGGGVAAAWILRGRLTPSAPVISDVATAESALSPGGVS